MVSGDLKVPSLYLGNTQDEGISLSSMLLFLFTDLRKNCITLNVDNLLE